MFCVISYIWFKGLISISKCFCSAEQAVFQRALWGAILLFWNPFQNILQKSLQWSFTKTWQCWLSLQSLPLDGEGAQTLLWFHRNPLAFCAWMHTLKRVKNNLWLTWHQTLDWQLHDLLMAFIDHIKAISYLWGWYSGGSVRYFTLHT